MNKLIKGFSKYSPEQKLDFSAELCDNPEAFKQELISHYHPEKDVQKRYGEFAENTLSNYFLPFNLAPNFLINGKVYHVPMVIEESSVVAAASSAASFWAKHGGFRCQIIDVEKLGHVYFKWNGKAQHLQSFFEKYKPVLLNELKPLTERMEKRGGGIRNILLDDQSNLPGVFRFTISFETANAMGANFINTVLEYIGKYWEEAIFKNADFSESEKHCEIVMCILSNNTPDCRVKATVSAPVEVFDAVSENYSGAAYAEKFKLAVDIALNDPFRAATHNKGIYNGVDAVVLATGNDFRATEAAGHSYAAASGRYKSLSYCHINDGIFSFTLELPLALGTVGGMTGLHPLAKRSLEILRHPSAEDLMAIAACAGLANNFSAVRALTTKGIQQGHMRMHLGNILITLGATESESAQIKKELEGDRISHNQVQDLLSKIRNG